MENNGLRRLGPLQRIRVWRGRCPECRGRIEQRDIDRSSRWTYRPSKYLTRLRPSGSVFLGLGQFSERIAERRRLRVGVCRHCRILVSGGYVRAIQPVDPLDD